MKYNVGKKGADSIMREACIEKALSWRDERLMRTFVWSLKLFNGLCVYLVVLG